jgi:hypothetical protein
MDAMTKEQIDAILDNVRSWPQEDQEELVELVRAIEARRAGLYLLSKDERKGIERGLDAMRKGNFASDERVAEIYRRARSTRA